MGKRQSRLKSNNRGSHQQYGEGVLSNQSKQKQLLVHKDAIKYVCPAGDGIALSGGSDQTLVMYDWKNTKLLQRWIGHEREITKVTYSDTLQAAFSASRDKSARMWKRAEGGNTGSQPVQSYLGHGLIVTGIAVDPAGKKLCTGSRDNFVHLWDIETGDCIKQSGKTRNLVTHICWVHGQLAVAQTSEDKSVRIWDTRTLQESILFPKKQYIQSHCDVSQDGNYVLSSSNGFNGQGCEVTLWDMRTTKLLNEYWGHEETVSACYFLPWKESVDLIATSSMDSTVKVWEQSTCKCLLSFRFPGSGSLTSIAPYADGSMVVSSSETGNHILQLKKLPDGSIVRESIGSY